MISNSHQEREDSHQCGQFITELKAILRECDEASGGAVQYDPSTDELWNLLAKHGY